jgi:hypothetical protein
MPENERPWDVSSAIAVPIGSTQNGHSASADEWMSQIGGPAVSVARPNTDIGQDAHHDRRSQRGMREIIAVWLIALLFLIICLAFTAVFLDDDPTMLDKRFQHLKSLLDVIIGPVATLLSSAIGFYFGMQVSQSRIDSAKPDN